MSTYYLWYLQFLLNDCVPFNNVCSNEWWNFKWMLILGFAFVSPTCNQLNYFIIRNNTFLQLKVLSKKTVNCQISNMVSSIISFPRKKIDASSLHLQIHWLLGENASKLLLATSSEARAKWLKSFPTNWKIIILFVTPFP